MKAIIEVGGMPFQFFPVSLTYYMYERKYIGNLIAQMEGVPGGVHCSLSYLCDKSTRLLLVETAQAVSYVAPVSLELMSAVKHQLRQYDGLKGAEGALFRSLSIPNPETHFTAGVTGNGRHPYLIVPAEQLSAWYTQSYHGWRIQTEDYYLDAAVIARNVKSLFYLCTRQDGQSDMGIGNVSSEHVRLKIVDGCLNVTLRFTW